MQRADMQYVKTNCLILYLIVIKKWQNNDEICANKIYASEFSQFSGFWVVKFLRVKKIVSDRWNIHEI